MVSVSAIFLELSALIEANFRHNKSLVIVF
jgi:hypothetical protein